jgi:hypothetical protein
MDDYMHLNPTAARILHIISGKQWFFLATVVLRSLVVDLNVYIALL